ncbi:MAG: hypothetical protein ACFFG0_10635 [Candidatus Thorarchaeota archaeon]
MIDSKQIIENDAKKSIESFYSSEIEQISVVNRINRNTFKYEITFFNKVEKKHFILKLGDFKTILHLNKTLCYCSDSEIRVPKIIYCDSNNKYLLLEFINGEKPLILNPTHLIQNPDCYIKMLCELHTSILKNNKYETFFNLPYNKLVSKYYTFKIWDILDNEAQNEIKFHQGLKHVDSHFKDKLQNVISNLVFLIKDNIELNEKYKPEYGFVHGDLHFKNILENNRKIFLLDFEFSHTSIILQSDLVKFLTWPKLEISDNFKLSFVNKYIDCVENTGLSVGNRDLFLTIFNLIFMLHKILIGLKHKAEPKEYLYSVIAEIEKESILEKRNLC